MSLNPDTVLKTTRQVLEVEARLAQPSVAAPAPGEDARS